MRAQFPSHLYIRVGKSLRAGLIAAASTEGVTVSTLARGLLRRALGGEWQSVSSPASRGGPTAAVSEEG